MQFALGAGRRIQEEYVKTGKVKFTFKHFPVVDQGDIGESNWAAQAAECASQQAKFWEYHNKLFGVWQGENVGTYTKSKLKQYAADLGLNVSTFNQCLDRDETASAVAADVDEAMRLGVEGTPSFFVNGRQLRVRSLDFTQFSQALDALLQ